VSNAAPVSNAVNDGLSLWSAGYGRFLVTMSASTLAFQMQNAVVGYQVYQLTGDPLALGVVGLAEAIPFISLALYGGHAADRWDRRRISTIGLMVSSLAALALLALSRAQGVLPSGASSTIIYALIALGGVCRSFLQPARLALGAQLVPRVQYARAVAWRTGVFQLSAVIGPALGGFAYAAVGPSGAYALVAALLIFAALGVASLPAPVRSSPPASAPLLVSLGEGFAYLARDRLLLPAIALDLFAVLFGGATALLPVFAKDILHVGPSGFGMLRAAPAVGALIASAVLALRAPLRRAGRALLLSVAGFGVCMVVFALSRSFVLSMTILIVGGGLDMVSVLVRSTLLQLRVPDHMLGRVGAISQIFIGSSNEIGAFESGAAARLMGTVPSVVFGGMMTLGVVGVCAWKAPDLRRLGPLAP